MSDSFIVLKSSRMRLILFPEHFDDLTKHLFLFNRSILKLLHLVFHVVMMLVRDDHVVLRKEKTLLFTLFVCVPEHERFLLYDDVAKLIELDCFSSLVDSIVVRDNNANQNSHHDDLNHNRSEHI